MRVGKKGSMEIGVAEKGQVNEDEATSLLMGMKMKGLG